MKKYVIVILFLLVANVLKAQKCFSAGTKTLYGDPRKNHLPPAGYEPVFINHVGRHGARHLTKDVSSAKAYQLLEKAESLQSLTGQGIRLKNMLAGLNEEEHKNLKSISLRGKEEQEGIAGRMYEANKEIFNAAKLPPVQVTKEKRTKETAEAFFGGLKKHIDAFSSSACFINDTTLRFFDLAPAYIRFEKEGNWQAGLAQLKSKYYKADFSESICTRFFKLAFLSNLKEQEKEDFINDVYGFLTIIPGVQQELVADHITLTADSISQFFSCKELAAISRIDQAEDYLLKGPGTDREGIQVIIAAPLLVDFIKTTDNYFINRHEQVQLRFCHAETIAPFAALLGIKGADRSIKNVKKFTDRVWDASSLVPLSANIQWVLYENGNHEKLIRIMLNEKDMKITGLPAADFPFYKWDDVRNLYMKKLDRLGISLNNNLFRYLQQLP